jgi:hypothetical protein
MGVAETSPSVSRRDGEGALKRRRRVRPDRLEWAQARGLNAWLHLLGCAGRERRQSRVCHRSRLKHCRRRLKHVPRPLAKFHEKTPVGAPHTPAGLRGLDPRVRSRSPTEGICNQGEECPISRIQHLREPSRHTHRCSGATVGDSPEGPLRNRGNPA